ncbi:MAG: RNA-directed DNA polymerase [Treponematales bacterium]
MRPTPSPHVFETQRKLLAGESVQNGFVEFDLHERGKKRHIKSVHISERVVQKCLCDEVLVPLLSRPLIHDNGASLKGKGVHFALRRLSCHLSRFYRRNGFSNEGYALLADFSKFFDSVSHEKLFSLMDKEIQDPRVRELTRRFVSVFGDGVSLGLGSQVSQVAAVFFPNTLDHFIKERLRVKYYGRYMDDFYLIHADKEYLKYCLAEIKKVCASLSLRLNEKKTRIVKLSQGVSFLKGRYVLLPTGRILRIPDRESAARMRRKLRKFKRLVEAGEMDFSDLRAAYRSWRGNYRKRFNNRRYSISRMDALYNALFIDTEGSHEDLSCQET